MIEIVQLCVVQIHTRTFRRTAIFGNSFHFLNKLRERHTWLFKSATRNRVHVETASIFITPAALCATGGRHLKENSMFEDELIIGLKTNGKYYVRPLDWAGCWDKNGKLKCGNTLFEADTEEEAKAYADGFRAGRTWK